MISFTNDAMSFNEQYNLYLPDTSRDLINTDSGIVEVLTLSDLPEIVANTKGINQAKVDWQRCFVGSPVFMN